MSRQFAADVYAKPSGYAFPVIRIKARNETRAKNVLHMASPRAPRITESHWDLPDFQCDRFACDIHNTKPLLDFEHLIDG